MPMCVVLGGFTAQGICSIKDPALHGDHPGMVGPGRLVVGWWLALVALAALAGGQPQPGPAPRLGYR